jgi:hypothetical protein
LLQLQQLGQPFLYTEENFIRYCSLITRCCSDNRSVKEEESRRRRRRRMRGSLFLHVHSGKKLLYHYQYWILIGCAYVDETVKKPLAKCMSLFRTVYFNLK